MMKEHPLFQDESRELRLASHCPICETSYLPIQTHSLWQEGDMQAFHLTCKKCGHAILALVTTSEIGASSIGLLTDLSYEDVIRFRLHSSVCLNDVIDVHLLLDQNDLSWIWSPEEQKQGKISVKRARKSVSS